MYEIFRAQLSQLTEGAVYTLIAGRQRTRLADDVHDVVD